MNTEIKDPLDKIGQRLGDLSDLPNSLRRQLVVTKLDDLEEKILHTIRNRFDSIASIDEIMVGLFRDFGYECEDRKVLASKIYRMTKAGHLESVPKRRGIVRIKSVSTTC